MLQSKVSTAARAFRDEDYAQAMTLYKELGEQLGHQFFAANLAGNYETSPFVRRYAV